MISDIDSAITTLQKVRSHVMKSNTLITRMPKRIKKYYIAHEQRDEVPWVRVSDLCAIELPRPIVVVNGAFDILHSGHMKILFAARQRARTLIVAMDSDARVARKGTGRPIQTFPERANTMNYMPVDYLIEIESDRDIAALFEGVTPDLRVQGYDYKDKDTKFPDVPKCFVRSGSMRTSKIVERCKRVV